MVDWIETFLDRRGPALSSAVVAYLVKDHGLTEVAARKRVSRAGGEVRRLSGVVFPHKARFMYLQQQFGSDFYWSHLVEALFESRSAYGYTIAALQQRGGLVPARHFAIVCGAPLRQSKHLAPETILERLTAAGLLSEFDVAGIGPCVALVQHRDFLEAITDGLRARMITEDMLLLAVSDWLRKLGIVSYGKVATRMDEKLPRVGTFAWDLTAPCYLGPLLRFDKEGKAKNGFVACDVHLGEKMTLAGVAPFLRKCATLRGLRKVGPCLQILVADAFEGDAFQALKHKGVIPATPSNLFGEEVAEGLRQLTTALESAAHSIINPEQFDTLFRKLGKIEGAANRLRGTLFEYMAADLARRRWRAQVGMNRMSRVSGEGEAEADLVIIDEPWSITMVECKGYSPRAIIPDELFQRWLRRTVPLCFKEITQHPDWRNLEARFEFWTTAPLSPASMALFADAKAAVKASRYTLELRLPQDLRQMCLETQDPNLIRAFESHFTKIEQDRPVDPTWPMDKAW